MRVGRKQLLSIVVGVTAVCLVFGQGTQARTPAEDGINPSTPPAVTPPARTSAATSPASGAVLASDNFSDPNTGILPQSAAGSPGDTTKVLRGYVNGEYQLATTDPNYVYAVSATVPGTFADVKIDVDARLVNPTSGTQGIYVRCRAPATETAPGWYELRVEPVGQSYSLLRIDMTAGSPPLVYSATLSADTNVAAINPGGASNHLTLTCAGNTIAASINGAQLASVQDSTYASGSVVLGANIFSHDLYYTFDARLSNLVITQP